MEDDCVVRNDYFSKLYFSSFCDACEKIISRNDKKKKFGIFQAFIKFHREKCNGDNFHPLMRLFLPNLERERGPYGVKEHQLAKTYIRILALPKDSDDAKRLLNYRAPSNVRGGDLIGDFAEVAYWILRRKCGQSTNITIGEINANLDLIAEKHASHEPRAVDDILISLFRKMSAEEQKWLIRVILKELPLGLSKKQMLYAFHPDSSEVFDLSNSLLKVCTMLNDVTVRLHEIEITMFDPFRPMLSDRCDVSKINFSQTLILETKYDGERFQLHYSGNKFKYFSRNGYEYTQNYGEDEYSGYLTSRIKKQFPSTLTSVILDGEMVGWNTNRSFMVTKAANIDVKKLTVGNIVQPCFFAFDILHFNGEVLTNKPLMERKEILDKCFEDLEGTIVKAPYSLVSSNEEILAAVNNAIDRCEEGIILKKMDSVYKPNSRSSGWFKIKPEYTEGGLVDLDLLIIGGYYGQKKQKGKVSHFMMGLAVPPTEGEHPTQFASLCRVGSGYTIPELEELTNKLDPSWQKLRPGNTPSFLLLSKEKPDLFISPEKSCILQIKATEVVESNVYYCGSTLKFVRVEKIRYDKPWYDCLKTTAFQELRVAYQGKLTSGPLEKNEKSNQRKIKNEIESLVDTYQQRISEVDKETSILEGKEFSVVSGYKEKSKESIEKLIIANGGVIKNTPGSNTFCIIAGDINLRVKNLCRSGKHVVAHISWLEDCLEKKKIVPWTPLKLAGTNLMGKCELDQNFDRFGDSYLQFTTETELKAIFDRMSKNNVNLPALDGPSLLEMDSLLFGCASPYSFLRGINAYFVVTDFKSAALKKGQRISFARKLFEFCGGKSVSMIDEFTNFVIMDSIESEAMDFQNINVALNIWDEQEVTPEIISSSWIFDSFSTKKRLSVSKYVLNVD